MNKQIFRGQSEGQERDLDEYLKAKALCEQLVFHSFHLIDSGEAEKVRDLFTADGVHTINEAVFEHDGLTKFFQDRQANVDRVTRHTVTNLRFELLAGHRARARYISAVYVMSSPQPIPGAVTDIEDTFVKDSVSSSWQLSRREVRIIAGAR
jgi:hypothetical protein